MYLLDYYDDQLTTCDPIVFFPECNHLNDF